jgi:hypothetical protein
MGTRSTHAMATVAALTVCSATAGAVEIEPLRQREGVVVKWQPQGTAAIVAFPSGRMTLIHTLRRFDPGRRATVRGIKWGTPTSGIKWSKPPPGVRWGIKWGRNGTYRSVVTPGRRAVWTPVRGPIVKRLAPNVIALGTRGGVITVRLAPAARPRTQAARVPPVGAVVSVRAFVQPNGVIVGRALKYLKPPIPGQVLPVGGEVESVDPMTRTLVLVDRQDPAHPVRFTVDLPDDIPIEAYAAGLVLALEGRLGTDGDVTAKRISRNETFARADDPDTNVASTDDDPACGLTKTACPTP